MSTPQPYEIALQAGHVLAYAFKPFVERHAPTPGDPESWGELIARSDAKRLGQRGAEYLLTDARVLLKTVRFHPEQYGEQFTAQDQEWAETALKTLNLAHSGRAISQSTVSRGIEAMQLLLESVGAEKASHRLAAVDEGRFEDFDQALDGLPVELAAPSESELPAPSAEELADESAPEPVYLSTPLEVPQTTETPENSRADQKQAAAPAPIFEPVDPVALILEDDLVPLGCRAADFRVGPVGVRVIYREALNFALIHNQVSPLDSVTAVHVDHEEEHTVEAVVAFGEADVVTAEPLHIGPRRLPAVPEQKAALQHSCSPGELAWQIGPHQFAQLNEAKTTTLRINVTIDGQLQTQTHHIELLARDEWHARSIPESLAAFVTPNSSGLVSVLQDASDRLSQRTGSSALNGYQEGPDRALQIARAVYDALAARGITYITPPASFEETGQKIRRIEDVLEHRMGTCLDLSVLYSAAIEQAGLNPVIVRVPGHAFAGFLTQDDQLAQPALADRGLIDNVVRAGLLHPVETTGVTDAGTLSFDEAKRATEHRFDDDIVHLLDIASAHRRVKPLPRFVQNPASGIIEMFTERPAATPLPTPAAADAAPSPVSYRESQEKIFPPRVRKWRQALLDLSLRNPLLSLRKSALDLIIPERSLADFEDSLARGTSLLLRATDDLSELGRAAGHESARKLGDDALDRILMQESTVYAGITQASYGTRLTSLRRAAKSAVEETGSNLLFVTLGALSWRTATGKEALAPLFLLPVRLDGSKKHRFHLSIDDGAQAQPNWALIEKLRAEFGLSISVLEEPPTDDHGIDIPRVLLDVRTALAKSKHPFHVKPDVRLAILQFSSIDMWRDLGAHWEEFLENRVVRHLVEEPFEPFHDHVEAEAVTAELEADAALPVSVDGSQLEAISWAGAGRTFVLEGPPGTGKSQTITNMIAETLDQGKTVLFVAEKQAALDVVRTRLQRVGLDPLTLQMHGSKQSVTDVRLQLLESWEAEADGNAASFEAQRDEYRRLIRSLDAYPDQLHGADHAPLSVWQAHQNYIGHRARMASSALDAVPLDVPPRVLRDSALATRAAEAADRVVNALRPLNGIAPDDSPWLLAGPAEANSTSTESSRGLEGWNEGRVPRDTPMVAVRAFLSQYDALGEDGRQLIERYPDPHA